MSLEKLFRDYKSKSKCIVCKKAITHTCNVHSHSCSYKTNVFINFFNENIGYYYLYKLGGNLAIFTLKGKLCEVDISKVEIDNINQLNTYVQKYINNIVFS